MDGVIVNFRGGRHTQYNNQMIVQAAGVDNREKARSLIGKTVIWTSPANKHIKGRVAREHGSNGALKVIFEKGMPGQSIGQKVVID
jgi:large subunit ribosomal protein L35Ae